MNWGINLAAMSRFSRSSVSRRELATIRVANKVKPSGRGEALNVYLFDKDGEIFTEPHVADFSRVASLKMEDADSLLRYKVLELDEEHRRGFQLKLAYYDGRPAKEYGGTYTCERLCAVVCTGKPLCRSRIK